MKNIKNTLILEGYEQPHTKKLVAAISRLLKESDEDKFA